MAEANTLAHTHILLKTKETFQISVLLGPEQQEKRTPQTPHGVTHTHRGLKTTGFERCRAPSWEFEWSGWSASAAPLLLNISIH